MYMGCATKGGVGVCVGHGETLSIVVFDFFVFPMCARLTIAWWI